MVEGCGHPDFPGDRKCRFNPQPRISGEIIYLGAEKSSVMILILHNDQF